MKFKYHFVIRWVYYKYTTLTLLKTAKLLFLKGKKVKCWRFHTAGVASSKLASPTKKSKLKSTKQQCMVLFLFPKSLGYWLDAI